MAGRAGRLTPSVIPAQAGTQGGAQLGSRLRGNDKKWVYGFCGQPRAPYPSGTPGIDFAVRIVRLVLTLATFGAGVSLLVRNS